MFVKSMESKLQSNLVRLHNKIKRIGLLPWLCMAWTPKTMRGGPLPDFLNYLLMMELELGIDKHIRVERV